MKSTKKDFELFKRYCREYVDKYELNNWTFLFHFGEKKEDNGKQSAWIRRNITNLQADIYLDPKWDYEKEGSGNSIREAAKHEVIHCLIGEIYLLAIEREGSYKEIDRAEEALVHKLEKLLKE